MRDACSLFAFSTPLVLIVYCRSIDQSSMIAEDVHCHDLKVAFKRVTLCKPSPGIMRCLRGE